MQTARLNSLWTENVIFEKTDRRDQTGVLL